MNDCVTFGETMLALRRHAVGGLALGDSFLLDVAGAESTVAIGMARLGHAVSWVGRVGADDAGDLVLRTLRAEGVDICGAARDPDHPTGLLMRERRTPALTRVRYFRGGSAGAQICPTDVLPHVVTGVRIVHATGITAALGDGPHNVVRETLSLAREVGAIASYDVNHRARLWSTADAAASLTDLVDRVDLLFCSEDELGIVSNPGGDPIAALFGRGVTEVVVKRGASGATAYRRDETAEVPAVAVQATDTVGAGDAFVAGYLSALLDGLPLSGRLMRAATTGAFAVTAPSDWQALPSRAELDLLDLAPDTTLR